MVPADPSREELLQENQVLRDRLAKAEEILQTIRRGEIDALVISTPVGERVFILQSADYTYRLIVEQMHEGAATLTPEGWISYCNQSLSTLLKQPLERVIGSKIQQFIAPGYVPIFEALIKSTHEGIATAAELAFVNSEGQHIPVYLAINHFTINEARTQFITVTDLTEKKQTEAIIASEQFARLILEQAGEAIIVCNQAGKVIRASQTALQLCGDDIIFQSFDQRLTFYGVSHPLPYATGSPLTQDHCFSIEAVLQGQSCQGLEVYFQRPDRQRVNLILSARPLIGASGQTDGAIVTLTDITDRKRNEAELQRAKADLEIRVVERTIELQQANQELQISEAKFRSLSECSPTGIFLTNPQGHCIYTNPRCQAILGCTFEESLGQGWLQPMHPEDQTRFMEQWEEVLTQPQEASCQEVRYVHSDGKTRYGQIQLAPLFTPEGTFNGYVGTIEDITEQRAIGQMKQDFISIVSHELRTPLTAIHGSLRLLASGIYDNRRDKYCEMLQIADSQTERLVRLVNDILSLQRLETGKATLVQQRCDAAVLMMESVNTMQAIAEQHQITLNVQPLHVELWAAPDAVIQTLTNLLSNAIKFSPSHTTISIRAAVVNEATLPQHMGSLISKGHQPSSKLLSLPCVLFQVQDQGQGIPADQLETIFDWFQQVDVSDAREKGGTGLGLTICRSIVQQHGGQIWAESVLGKGSTFYFTLPLPPEA